MRKILFSLFAAAAVTAGAAPAAMSIFDAAPVVAAAAPAASPNMFHD